MRVDNHDFRKRNRFIFIRSSGRPASAAKPLRSGGQGTQILPWCSKTCFQGVKNVDGRDKPGHDDVEREGMK